MGLVPWWGRRWGAAVALLCALVLGAPLSGPARTAVPAVAPVAAPAPSGPVVVPPGVNPPPISGLVVPCATVVGALCGVTPFLTGIFTVTGSMSYSLAATGPARTVIG